MQIVFRDREEALLKGDLELVKETTKWIIKWKQHERQEYVHTTIDKDLDIRDKLNGIRELKKPYKPIPCAIRDKCYRKVRIRDRAEAAATHFENTVWNNESQSTTAKSKQQNAHNKQNKQPIAVNKEKKTKRANGQRPCTRATAIGDSNQQIALGKRH